MRALLPVAALLISTAILLTGSGLQGVLLPVRASAEHFSTTSIALISSCYFAGFAGGCLLGPRLVRQVGHIRTFTAMTAVAAAIALLHGLMVVAPLWWLLRTGSGFCFAVLFMVIESWLNERSSREDRGKVLSAYMIITLTVMMLGQMLLPLWDVQGLELFTIASILVSLAAVPVALSGAVAPPPIQSTKIRLGRLLRTSPAGLGSCFTMGLASGPFWALGPEFAQANDLDERGVAVFMSAAVLGGALGQWPLGRLSDRGDRRRVMLLAATVAAGAGVVLSLRPIGTDLALYGMALVWGAFHFPIYSLAVAHTNDHAAPEDFVETSSGLLLVFAAGAILGPLLASGVTGMFGAAALFFFGTAIYGLLAVFLALRQVRVAPVPEAEQIRFADALQAATTVSQVFDAEIQTELEASQDPDSKAATAR